MSGTSTGRKVVGVIGGLVVAAVVVGVVEAIGHRLYPLPAGMNLTDPDDVRSMIQVMSPQAKSVVLGAWFLGAFIGGWVAMTIARWRPAPWIVAGFILFGGIWSMVMIPHPIWMMAAGVVLPLLAALLVSRRVQPA
jgi:hypothetical protein